MANSNQRDEKIRYVFDTDGAEKLGAIEKTLGDITEKSLGTETAFSFIKSHLEELTVAAIALETAFKAIEFSKESFSGAAAAEESMARLRAIAGDATQQFADLDGAIGNAAQAVNVDSQTATAGLTALLGAGLNLKAGMDALVPTLQLAKIANVDVGTAADTVAKTLAAFNLPASEAQKVVDELATASHGAAGGLSAILDATGKLAPDAKAIGLGFEDLTAIVGSLAQRGIAGREALGGLRTVFQELQNPTSKLRLELSAMGDDTADFGKAITTLSSGTPRAQEALTGLGGSARTVVQAFGAEGPQAIDKFTAALNNAGGAAGKTSAAIDDTLNGAWKKFSLTVDDIGEKLAKPVLEPFKDELIKLASELNKFAESPDFKDIESQIGSMAKNAAKALDDFLHNVDWKTFLADAKATLSGMADGFDTLASKASAAASTISTAISVIDGAYQAAGVAIDGAVHVAAKGVDTLAAAATGGASNLTAFHDTLQDVADLAGGQMTERMEKLGAIMDGAAASTDKATTATTHAVQATHEHAAAVADAAPKVDKYQEAEQRLAKAAVDADAAQQKAADAIKQVGAASAAAAEAAKPFADRLLDADQAARKAAAGADALKTAFQALHIVSQQSLEQTAIDAANAFAKIDAASDSTAAGLADKQNAFLAYAKAVSAASENLDEGTRASTAYMLESKAAALGLAGALPPAIQKMLGLADSARTASGEFDHIKNKTEAAKAALDDLAGGNGGGGAGDAEKSLEEMASGGGESLAQLDNALANTRQGFLNVSEAAAKAFDRRLVGDFFNAFDSTGIGFAKVIDGMNQAAADTNAEIADQRRQLDEEIKSISEVGTKSQDSFGQFGKSTQEATTRLQLAIDQLKYGNAQFDLLGNKELGPLQQALDAAKQRVQALADATAAAADKFKELAQSVHDELLQEQGDQATLEDERHKNQLQAIKDAADAGKVSQQQYQQAVADENALHDLKMKHMQEQQQQARQSSGGGSSGAGGSGGGASGAGGSSSYGQSQSAGTSGGAVSSGVPMRLNYAGRTVNIIAGSPAEADSVESMLQEIARQRVNSINK